MRGVVEEGKDEYGGVITKDEYLEVQKVPSAKATP